MVIPEQWYAVTAPPSPAELAAMSTDELMTDLWEQMTLIIPHHANSGMVITGETVARRNALWEEVRRRLETCQ